MPTTGHSAQTTQGRWPALSCRASPRKEAGRWAVCFLRTLVQTAKPTQGITEKMKGNKNRNPSSPNKESHRMPPVTSRSSNPQQIQTGLVELWLRKMKPCISYASIYLQCLE